MKKYDWVSNIKTNIFMLRTVGLWPTGGDSYQPGPYMVYMAILLSTFLLAHVISQAIEIYYKRSDLEAVTGIVYILLVEMIATFKTYHLIKNMKIVKQLLKILEADLFQPTNTIQISAIERNIWFWNIIFKGLLYTCCGSNLFWTLFPLLDKTESGERRLPFQAWYPYNEKLSPLYEITYIYQIVSVCFISIVHLNIDGLLAALNVFNGSQFDILCDNLKNLHKLGENVTTSFINCVKHHKAILNFAAQSNKFLNWILFVQFFLFTLSIGITMFQLTLVTPLSNQFFSLVSYGSAITIQIFMYCWFGNEVEVKSNNVPYAVFECDWTDFSKGLKKDLLFFTLRAQKPVKLSASNLFYLSLDTFMRILKTSWSYFALLNQVTSKK